MKFPVGDLCPCLRLQAPRGDLQRGRSPARSWAAVRRCADAAGNRFRSIRHVAASSDSQPVVTSKRRCSPGSSWHRGARSRSPGARERGGAAQRAVSVGRRAPCRRSPVRAADGGLPHIARGGPPGDLDRLDLVVGRWAWARCRPGRSERRNAERLAYQRGHLRRRIRSPGHDDGRSDPVAQWTRRAGARTPSPCAAIAARMPSAKSSTAAAVPRKARGLASSSTRRLSTRAADDPTAAQQLTQALRTVHRETLPAYAASAALNRARRRAGRPRLPVGTAPGRHSSLVMWSASGRRRTSGGGRDRIGRAGAGGRGGPRRAIRRGRQRRPTGSAISPGQSATGRARRRDPHVNDEPRQPARRLPGLRDRAPERAPAIRPETPSASPCAGEPGPGPHAVVTSDPAELRAELATGRRPAAPAP